MFSLAAMTAAAYLLATVPLFRKSLPHYWAHPIGFVTATLLLLNGLSQLYPLEPSDVARIMVVPVGAALVFLSFRWLFLTLAVALAGWRLIAWDTLSPDQLFPTGTVLLGGALISVAVQGMRLVAHRRLLRLSAEQGREKTPAGEGEETLRTVGARCKRRALVLGSTRRQALPVPALEIYAGLRGQ